MSDLSLFDLSGKRALVTGASRGIGRALADALARAGADVAMTARTHEALAESAELITARGRRCLTIGADIADAQASRDAITQIAESWGGLDILVNNAGIEQVSPSLDVDETLWNSIIDTNLKGAFFCAQAAGRLMQSQRSSGSIINLCSLTSEIGIPTAVPYGASKSGLLGMTRALAAEWAPAGIRVNAIIPGYFRTQLTESFYQDEAWQHSMLGKIPMGRFGQMQDLAGLVIFLAGDASAYVTGQSLAVDGGFLASI